MAMYFAGVLAALGTLCCGLGVPPELDAAAHLEGLPDGALLQYSLSTTPLCGVGPH